MIYVRRFRQNLNLFDKDFAQGNSLYNTLDERTLVKFFTGLVSALCLLSWINNSTIVAPLLNIATSLLFKITSRLSSGKPLTPIKEKVQSPISSNSFGRNEKPKTKELLKEIYEKNLKRW